jgi:hypothetical protein
MMQEAVPARHPIRVQTLWPLDRQPTGLHPAYQVCGTAKIGFAETLLVQPFIINNERLIELSPELDFAAGHRQLTAGGNGTMNS